MNLKTKYLHSLITLLLLGCGIVAESSNNSNVDWHPVTGKDNEIVVYFPSKFQTVTDDGFTRSGVTINKFVTVFRVFNNTVLLMEYYDGGGKSIRRLEQGKWTPITEEKIGEFSKWDFTPEKGVWAYVQHYLIGNRLYILKSSKSKESDVITKAFFESVSLSVGMRSKSSNLSSDVTTTALPALVENQVQLIGDDTIFDSKDVDRKAIPIYKPRPRWGSTANVKLKVLYSSSGKVTKVVIERDSKEFERYAIEAAMKSVFIPAEKGGRFVSTFQTFEYNSLIR